MDARDAAQVQLFDSCGVGRAGASFDFGILGLTTDTGRKSLTKERRFMGGLPPEGAELILLGSFSMCNWRYARHHPFPIGTMILGVPAPADGIASCPLEVDRLGVEEHDGHIGEQVTAPREQLFLDEVLVGARSERRGSILAVLRKNLSQPSHGPVEVEKVPA